MHRPCIVSFHPMHVSVIDFKNHIFFQNGLSIMEEVATGGAGGSGEQLPMVLKVPHLIQHPLLNCFESYSMLGFGDILVPGLLVSFKNYN